MDNQHRHELQENDLQHFILRWRVLVEKYWQPVLLGFSLVILAFTLKRYMTVREHRANEEAWMDLATISSPESARAVAKSHSQPAVVAQAYLVGGDLCLNRATSPMAQAITEHGKVPATQSSNSAVSPADSLKTAAEMYKMVLNLPDANLIFKLNARLGLAAVAEAQLDFKEAAAQYDTVIKDAGTTYAAIKAQAEGRKQWLSQLEKPVTLGVDEPAATQPAIIAAPTATAPATKQ